MLPFQDSCVGHWLSHFLGHLNLMGVGGQQAGCLVPVQATVLLMQLPAAHVQPRSTP